MNSLVQFLIENKSLRTQEIIDAFLKINRADFILEKYRNMAYEDIPLPIGHDQTISQPSTVAFMLELLKPQKGQRILDIGSGSGWTTAILAEIVGDGGKVVGTEMVPELVAFGRKNIQKYLFPQAVVLQAGEELGYKEEAPYDRILVSASAVNIPQGIIDQLKPSGIMVLPVGNSVWEIKKDKDGNIKTKEYLGFVFVPLVY
jgi:protein-L-isoaspartate(D-aspartate) O-methyltransferase